MQIPLRIINLGLARLWKLKATKSKNISSNTMNMSRFSLWSPGCWRKSSYTTRGGGAFSRCHQGILGLGGGAVLNLGSLLDWLDSYFFGWLIHWLVWNTEQCRDVYFYSPCTGRLDSPERQTGWGQLWSRRCWEGEADLGMIARLELGVFKCEHSCVKLIEKPQVQVSKVRIDSTWSQSGEMNGPRLCSALHVLEVRKF